MALMRLILRRDRIRIALWIIIIPALVLATVAQITELYQTPESLVEFADSIRGNKALAAISGPSHGTEVLGGRVAYELWQTGMMIAIMSLIAVPRHTRAEEETDRLELLRAGVVGRHAMSLAAVTVASATSVVIGILSSIALMSNGLGANGSLLLGAAFASIGVLFAAIGLVTSQLTHHARSAKGLALGLLGLAFVIRAIGDSGNESISMLSPLGWMQATRPFTQNRWWIIALFVLASAASAAVGWRLESKRDLGAGMIAAKPGPANAGPRLNGTIGLAWRLHKGSIAAWAAGVTVYGAAIGSILNSFEDIIGDNEAMRDYIEQLAIGSINDVLAATMLLYFAMFGAACGIACVLTMRTEEVNGRLEHLLSHPLSRRNWFWSHLLFAFGGALTVIAGGAIGMGAVYSLTGGGASEFPRTVLAGLSLTPAVGVLIAAASAAYAWLPKIGHGVWSILAYTILITMFGEVLNLPTAVRWLSPMHHAAAAPAEDIKVLQTGALLTILCCLIAFALIGFSRRDARSS